MDRIAGTANRSARSRAPRDPLLIDLIVSHSDGWFTYLLEGPGPRGAEVLADLDSSVQPGFVYRPSDR